MKHLLLSGLIILLVSCEKEDMPVFVNDISGDVVKYVIYHRNNIITDYLKYINGQLIETTIYNHNDSIVERISVNTKQQVISKRIYYIGENGYATEILDSLFVNSKCNSIGTWRYEYKDDYILKESLSFKDIGSYPYSGQVYYNYTIENSNIMSSTKSSNFNTSECTKYFEYGDKMNLIDIEKFDNGLTGKINKNLVIQSLWSSGCPCGPTSTSSYSDYAYDLAANGYVLKKTVTHTPCYNIPTTGIVKRKVNHYYYEYIRQ